MSYSLSSLSFLGCSSSFFCILSSHSPADLFPFSVSLPPPLLSSPGVSGSGAVYSWGLGIQGQLGHGEVRGVLSPQRIRALEGERVIQVAAGWYHSLCLSANGEVFGWGHSDRGQL